eukprot:1161257-Pelagomonas_calceolata.AAC.7
MRLSAKQSWKAAAEVKCGCLEGDKDRAEGACGWGYWFGYGVRSLRRVQKGMVWVWSLRRENKMSKEGKNCQNGTNIAPAGELGAALHSGDKQLHFILRRMQGTGSKAVYDEMHWTYGVGLKPATNRACTQPCNTIHAAL